MKVFSVATRELADSAFAKWAYTAKKFNYDYEIINRHDSWKGWKFRTACYIAAVEKSTAKLIMLTDNTDLFFTAPSTEVITKFATFGKDIVFSGENSIWYLCGHYNEANISSFFTALNPGKKILYPNGGALMGKREKILELLHLISSYEDDQGGYYDMIFGDKINYAIDCDSKIFATFPKDKQAEDIFVFDNKMQRYKNIISDEYPCLLHFNFKNFDLMDTFYSNLQL